MGSNCDFTIFWFASRVAHSLLSSCGCLWLDGVHCGSIVCIVAVQLYRSELLPVEMVEGHGQLIGSNFFDATVGELSIGLFL